MGIPGGMGKCNLCAAILSPGASNVTTGTPNESPMSEAREPPSCRVVIEREFEDQLARVWA